MQFTEWRTTFIEGGCRSQPEASQDDGARSKRDAIKVDRYSFDDVPSVEGKVSLAVTFYCIRSPYRYAVRSFRPAPPI